MQILLLCFVFFFFNDTATTEIYTLSLHDALPISHLGPCPGHSTGDDRATDPVRADRLSDPGRVPARLTSVHEGTEVNRRSEEHTSELQSHLNLVCRLLLEKKKRRTAQTSPHRL